MNFYKLDASGFFFARKSVVRVSEKPTGVMRYIIYQEVELPTVILVQNEFYDMRNGEILEVVTESLERFFYAYVESKFVRKFFTPIDILEGEYELERQLRLPGSLAIERKEMLKLAHMCGIA